MAIASNRASVVTRRRTQRLLASGNFTVPANIYELDVLCVGGGGGGGGASSTTASANTGGGGGGGGWPMRARLAVTPGQVIAGVVGAGGAGGGLELPGATGTTTTFAEIQAWGGGGGGAGAVTVNQGLAAQPSGWTAAAANAQYWGAGGGGYSGGGGTGTGGTNNLSLTTAGRGGQRGMPGYGASSGSGGGGAYVPIVNNLQLGWIVLGTTFNPYPLPPVENVAYGAGGHGGATAVSISLYASGPYAGANGAPNTGNGGGGGYSTATGATTVVGGNGGSGLIVITWDEVA